MARTPDILSGISRRDWLVAGGALGGLIVVVYACGGVQLVSEAVNNVVDFGGETLKVVKDGATFFLVSQGQDNSRVAAFQTEVARSQAQVVQARETAAYLQGETDAMKTAVSAGGDQVVVSGNGENSANQANGGVSATEKPTVTPAATLSSEPGITCADITNMSSPMLLTEGIPDQVPANGVYYPPVDSKKGGEAAAFAVGEPGTLLFGKDAPQSTVDATKGSGEFLEKGKNQFVIAAGNGEGRIPLGEGRFFVFSGQEGVIDIDGTTWGLVQKDSGEEWLAVVKTDDTVKEANLRCVVPNHNMEMVLPAGLVASEGWVMQQVNNALNKDNVKRVKILVADASSNATSLFVVDESDPTFKWQLESTNVVK